LPAKTSHIGGDPEPAGAPGQHYKNVKIAAKSQSFLAAPQEVTKMSIELKQNLDDLKTKLEHLRSYL